MKSGLGVDGLDLDDGKLLAMAFFALVALAAFFLKDDDFFATFIFKDFGGNRGAFDLRSADGGGFAVLDEKNVIEADSVARCRVRVLIDDQNVAFCDRKLAPLGMDGGFFHGKIGLKIRVEGKKPIKRLFTKDQAFSVIMGKKIGFLRSPFPLLTPTLPDRVPWWLLGWRGRAW